MVERKTFHMRLYSPCRLERMSLLTKQSCILSNSSAPMLCFESSLSSFSLHEWKSDPHTLTRKFCFGLSMTCFLDKTGTTYLSHRKQRYFFPLQPNRTRVNLATKPCISPISCRILQNSNPIFFIVSVIESSLLDDSTCAIF